MAVIGCHIRYMIKAINVTYWCSIKYVMVSRDIMTEQFTKNDILSGLLTVFFQDDDDDFCFIKFLKVFLSFL